MQANNALNALYTEMLTVTGIYDVMEPNVGSAKPANGRYIKLSLQPVSIDRITLMANGGLDRSIGLFWAQVFCKENEGAVKSFQMCDAIVEHFKPPKSMTFGGATVVVDKTPDILAPLSEGQEYIIPVAIRYRVDKE